MNEVSIAATAASTALPPARSTSAPARAVSGCPAATTPRSAISTPLCLHHSGWLRTVAAAGQRFRAAWPRPCPVTRLTPYRPLSHDHSVYWTRQGRTPGSPLDRKALRGPLVEQSRRICVAPLIYLD